MTDKDREGSESESVNGRPPDRQSQIKYHRKAPEASAERSRQIHFAHVLLNNDKKETDIFHQNGGHCVLSPSDFTILFDYWHEGPIEPKSLISALELDVYEQRQIWLCPMVPGHPKVMIVNGAFSPSLHAPGYHVLVRDRPKQRVTISNEDGSIVKQVDFSTLRCRPLCLTFKLVVKYDLELVLCDGDEWISPENTGKFAQRKFVPGRSYVIRTVSVRQDALRYADPLQLELDVASGIVEDRSVASRYPAALTQYDKSLKLQNENKRLLQHHVNDQWSRCEARVKLRVMERLVQNEEIQLEGFESSPELSGLVTNLAELIDAAQSNEERCVDATAIRVKESAAALHVSLLLAIECIAMLCLGKPTNQRGMSAEITRAIRHLHEAVEDRNQISMQLDSTVKLLYKAEIRVKNEEKRLTNNQKPAVNKYRESLRECTIASARAEIHKTEEGKLENRFNNRQERKKDFIITTEEREAGLTLPFFRIKSTRTFDADRFWAEDEELGGKLDDIKETAAKTDLESKLANRKMLEVKEDLELDAQKSAKCKKQARVLPATGREIAALRDFANRRTLRLMECKGMIAALHKQYEIAFKHATVDRISFVLLYVVLENTVQLIELLKKVACLMEPMPERLTSQDALAAARPDFDRTIEDSFKSVDDVMNAERVVIVNRLKECAVDFLERKILFGTGDTLENPEQLLMLEGEDVVHELLQKMDECRIVSSVHQPVFSQTVDFYAFADEVSV